MSTVWERLFKNNPEPANNSRALVLGYEPGEETPSANPPGVANSGSLPSDPGRNGEAPPKSLKVARTFELDRPAQRRSAHASGRH